MIKILNDSTINKIAAGEVIERPSNVIKELLENSFDSGADEIKIEIIDSGLKKIKITDNGSGMTKEDLVLSIKRHATSKINDENDLFNIKTLGFRGEALASIAEVSNLKIITKTFEQKIGHLLEIEAGKVLRIETIATNNGTMIEVNDLFFNVPIRKKFLKSSEIEFFHIVNIVTKYAIIKDASIRLIHNNNEILYTKKSNSLIDNIISVYGPEISKNLIKVEYENNSIKIRGYISKPALTRSDKSDQSLYVNSRFVKDNIISNAIYEAYKTLLFINRHPIFMIEIILDTNDIDVNVHPAKTEIKFKDEKMVWEVIYEAIKAAFKKSNLIADVELLDEGARKAGNNYDFTKDKQSVLHIGTPVILSKEIAEKKENIFSEFKILGQINKTFILAENPFGLAIIDQHAAEERVNYEKFMREKTNKAIIKQKFLSPRIIEVSPLQKQLLENNILLLKNLGFDFEIFGRDTIKLETIPQIFERLKSTIFIDIVNELMKFKSQMIGDEVEERIIRFACRESVKAGDELTIVQMKRLLEDLAKTNNPYSCPHGRPTIINLTVSDLEKKFKRTGW